MTHNSINTLCGLEEGSRVFILGNGPSLSSFDLSRINKNDIIIVMNSYTILEKKYNIKSNYYVVSDVRFITNSNKRDCATAMLDQNTIRVFREEIKAYDDKEYFNRTYYIRAIGRDGFSGNLEYGYYFGCSTTMLAIQLAYYLGCKDIFLLGVDLNYMSGSMRFYKEKAIEFPDPFISVQIFNLRKAFNFLSEKNIGLFNCSDGSFVRPYIPYKDYDSIF